MNPKNTVSWTFEAVPGTVKVEAEIACDAGSAGSTCAVKIGEQAATGKVDVTGGRYEFRRVTLEKTTVDRAGKITGRFVRLRSRKGR